MKSKQGGIFQSGAVYAAVALGVGVLASGEAPAASAWKPDKNVEIIINTAPGSGQDVTGRTVQRILQERRLVEIPLAVVNKPGGGGAIAYNYLNQHQGNGHFVAIASKSLLTNHIMGRTPITYTDVTPLAILFGEYISVAVKADSEIRNGKDLIERLKKDPTAYSFGIASSLGNPNHQGVAMALKAAGVDLKKVRNVVFQSGAIAVTSLLGGHVDVVPGSVGLMLRHVESGSVRLIAIAAPQRLSGVFAQSPTWREQGANVVVSNWRGLIGPKGLSSEQVAFWDSALQKLNETEDWRKDLERNHWANEYMGGAATRKYMEAEYGGLRSFLTDLELAK
jgi:putative tricarboxylic transport membrane protein